MKQKTMRTPTLAAALQFHGLTPDDYDRLKRAEGAQSCYLVAVIDEEVEEIELHDRRKRTRK